MERSPPHAVAILSPSTGKPLLLPEEDPRKSRCQRFSLVLGGTAGGLVTLGKARPEELAVNERGR